MSSTSVETRISKKILIIEDEGEMCLLLNILLNDEEMELEHVKTLSAAGEWLANDQPSLIILDNKLPDGYGIDYIGHLKANYPSVKIIMISGFDNSAGDIALANGADFFLGKPFKKQDLYEAIKTLMYS
jgi:two-component system OmpR family response regulator